MAVQLRSKITTMESRLPSDVESEEGVVACLLSSPRSIAKVQDLLTREDFCDARLGELFDVALTVFRKGKTCTKQNIIYELKNRKLMAEIETSGMVSYSDLEHYACSILSSDPILDHATRLKEVSTQRKLAIFAYELYQSACRSEASVEEAEQELVRVSLGTSIDSIATLGQMMIDYQKELDRRRENFKNHVANGVPTNFTTLDHLLGGLQPADLLVLAARPSIGKTAMALNVALNIVSRSRHALIFSLEMNKNALAQRLVAMEAPMDQTRLRDGDVEDENLEKVINAMGNLSQLDLKVDDRTRKISDIKSKARHVHSIKPLDVIIVDYLQLVRPAVERGKNGNRVEEVAEVSRGLKELAMELNVPVLALAQLNRAIESRADKRPQKSDLKESGAIEQDSDVIMFLHVREEQMVKRMNCEPYEIDIIVDKHRNGPIGEVVLEFRPRSTKFIELMEASTENAI